MLLRGFARSWPALNLWRDHGTFGRALADDKLVTCLRSSDGRRFLGIDCAKSQLRLVDVVNEIFGVDAHSESWPVENYSQRQSLSASSAAADDNGLCANNDGASRLYARAPLCGGLREAVDLGPLETLMAGAVPSEHCCSVWLGSSHNITPFHYDLCHGFLSGICGSKTFTLVSPDDWRLMYARPDRPELSRVDYEAVREGKASVAGREEQRRRPGPCALTVYTQSPCSHRTATIQYSHYSHTTAIVQSRCRRCGVAMQSLCSHYTVTAVMCLCRSPHACLCTDPSLWMPRVWRSLCTRATYSTHHPFGGTMLRLRPMPPPFQC